MDAAVIRPNKCDFNPTFHVFAVLLLGFLPLCRKASGNNFQCRLFLDPEKVFHCYDKGSEVPMMFEAGVKIILIVCLLCVFQALLGGFRLAGGGVIIHDPHVVNTDHPLSSKVCNEDIPLQLYFVI